MRLIEEDRASCIKCHQKTKTNGQVEKHLGRQINSCADRHRLINRQNNKNSQDKV